MTRRARAVNSRAGAGITSCACIGAGAEQISALGVGCALMAESVFMLNCGHFLGTKAPDVSADEK